MIPSLQQNLNSSLSFKDFDRALPQARAIYNKYQADYSDEHSKWLGRWIERSERLVREAFLATKNEKQQITDKLITKLMTQILASPYDRAPFERYTNKAPVLFKGMIFPQWMLEDILNLIGNSDGWRLTKPHAFMHEMLEWAHALQKPSQAMSSTSSAMIPVTTGGALVSLHQTSSTPYLNSDLLVSIPCPEQSEFTMRKLFIYRRFINNAFREIQVRAAKREARKQLKQIVSFGNEQKALMQKDQTQTRLQQAGYKQAMTQQYEDISQIQQSTQNVMKEHFQYLLDQIAATEEKLRKLQQECKEKEASIQSYVEAQRNLRN